jgi:hypothetical protein
VTVVTVVAVDEALESEWAMTTMLAMDEASVTNKQEGTVPIVVAVAVIIIATILLHVHVGVDV